MADWPYLGNSRISDDGQGSARKTVDTGSANTKTAWVEMTAVLAHSISGILIETQNQPSEYQVIDIGIGAAGSEFVVVPELRMSQPSAGTHGNHAVWVPISLPAGIRIAARSQGSVGGGFMRLKFQYLGDAWAGLQSPTRYEDWGFVAATTKGTQFTAGNGVKGSWVELKAATSFTSKWLLVHYVGDSAAADMWVDVGIGAAGSEVVLIPDVAFTIEVRAQTLGPFPLSVPPGTRVAARGRAGAASTTSTVHITAGG